LVTNTSLQYQVSKLTVNAAKITESDWLQKPRHS